MLQVLIQIQIQVSIQILVQVHCSCRYPCPIHPSINPSISTLLENDEKLDGRYTVLTIIDRVPSFVMQAWFNKYVPGDHCTPDAVQITVLSGSATPDTLILTKQLPVCALLCGTRCPRRILLVPVPKKQFKQIDFETCAILNLGLSSNATFK